jgi:hypothetical protein
MNSVCEYASGEDRLAALSYLFISSSQGFDGAAIISLAQLCATCSKVRIATGHTDSKGRLVAHFSNSAAT